MSPVVGQWASTPYNKSANIYLGSQYKDLRGIHTACRTVQRAAQHRAAPYCAVRRIYAVIERV